MLNWDYLTMIPSNVFEIVKTKRGKCVGICEYNKILYYAVSGNDENPKVNKVSGIVEGMIGGKPIRCTINDSFTVILYSSDCITRIMKPYYESIVDLIYSTLKYAGTCTYNFVDYVGMRIRFKQFMLNYPSIHSIRNYSCVERKIIGKIGSFKSDIYVGMRPCYYCLPVIRNVIYKEKDSVFRINRVLRSGGNSFKFRLAKI